MCKSFIKKLRSNNPTTQQEVRRLFTLAERFGERGREGHHTLQECGGTKAPSAIKQGDGCMKGQRMEPGLADYSCSSPACAVVLSTEIVVEVVFMYWWTVLGRWGKAHLRNRNEPRSPRGRLAHDRHRWCLALVFFWGVGGGWGGVLWLDRFL